MTNVPAASDISLNEGIMRLIAVHNLKPETPGTKAVTFSYVKGDDPLGPIERRRLIPEKVRVAPGGVVYFEGNDPDREAWRQYRIDRIRGEVRIEA